MENKKKRMELAMLSLCLAFFLLVGSIGAQSCSIAPGLELGKGKISIISGRMAEVEVTVKGTQSPSCGTMQYGVDFTNGYDGKLFSLSLLGLQERNLFYLKPGETKTFKGLIGIPPGTQAGNYTVQVTSYLEADHWKQASRNIAVEVKPEAGNDAYWETHLEVGWNSVPYAKGLAYFGCDAIITGYRYSPDRGDYVVMDRYGPLFSPAPFEPDFENERFGAMFVFSKKRCSLVARVPSSSFEGGDVSLLGGQLLSVPPSWHGQKASDIVNECRNQSGSGAQVSIGKWDAKRQKWVDVGLQGTLLNGDVLRINPKSACSLDLRRALGG